MQFVIGFAHAFLGLALCS